MSLGNKTAIKLAQARKELDMIDRAIETIVSGAQQYSMGTRSVSKADLKTLLDERKKVKDFINALENPGGRFKRVVPTDR